MTPILEVKNMCKRFDNVSALEDASLSIEAGESVALLGPNGAGKTTLFRIIVGILSPTAGKVLIDGKSNSLPESKLKLAYVPEVPSVYPLLTVDEHLTFVSLAFRVQKDVQQRREMLLGRLELSQLKDRLAGQLSKGQKQRLLLACALMHDAEILLIDEPLIGLDPRGAFRLKEILTEYKHEGRAILLSTHQLELAQVHAERIIILCQGRIRAFGSVDQLRQQVGASNESSLEDVFLMLTDGHTDIHYDENARANKQ